MAQENTRESQIDALRDMVIEAQEVAERLRIDLVYDDGQIIVVEPPRCNNFRATLKERQEGQPCFIEIEPRTNIEDPVIVFDMKQGTTFEEAKDLTSKLNRLCRLAEILS